MRRFWLILAILTILSTIVASPMFPVSKLPLPSLPKAHATTRSIVMIGNQAYGWNSSNPSITAYQGDSVSVALSSGDGLSHRFVVDVDKDGKGFSPTCPPDKCSVVFPPSTTYSFTADFTGSYTYYCTYHSATMFGSFNVNGPDFGVSSNPSSLSIPQGSKANSTISVTSLGNFAGPVSLSSSSSALMTSFSPNSVMVLGGGTGKSNLTVSIPFGTTPGPYSVIVTASNSSTSRSANVAVMVPAPGYSISANPVSLTINSGSSLTSTLLVAGSNGFAGTVSLTTTVPSGRATATLSPSSVTLSSTTTSATSTLTVSSALGMFNVTVTATSGGTSQSAQVLVNGPDFSITTGSRSVSVNQGSSASLTVTLSSVNAFSGSISLSASPSPGGPPVTVSPTSIQVPSSGSVSATLTVTASSSGAYSTPISPGTYTITLNATMGSLSHTEIIPLTVTSPSSAAGILASPIVIGGIVAAVVIVGIVVYALGRRSKK
ncbi:hypothetical protein E6H34_09640 [Candidatus Bathyarchaeota archaeon]|nr:MAG: hypothetical protein E6H34_09640 [Candidatus Bathyarchaeota archaeon]